MGVVIPFENKGLNMSTSIEGLAFGLGVQVANADCDAGDKLLALARAGLEAAAQLARHGDDLQLRKVQQAFQGAAEIVRAELKESTRRAA